MALTLSGTTGLTFADNTAQNTAASGFGFKNRLINGDFKIDQRNRGASQTISAGSAAVYTVDRWFATCSGANVTGQRIAGNIANSYSYRLTGAIGNTTITFSQRIESYNIADLTGQVVTFAVDIANSLVGTVYWTASYPNSQDNYSTTTSFASGSFAVNSTLSRYSTQITLPSQAANGLQISLVVNNQVSGTFTVACAQLEKGPTATPFDVRSFGTEDFLCKRYAYKLGGQKTYECIGAAVGTSSTEVTIPLRFPVEMRVVPTLTYSGSYLIGMTNQAVTAFSIDDNTSTTDQTDIKCTTTGVVLAGSYLVMAAGTLNVSFLLSAEL